MAMVVKNNMSALSTLNTLNRNTLALSNSLQKVSTGMKINSAKDDASGYAISERMRVQIRSLDQAKANTTSGQSMLKVAEGAVSSTVDILKTLKEKVINAANDTNTDEDRKIIQKELNQSIDQINDNANVTFNGKYLVDGSHNSKVTATTATFTNNKLSEDTVSGTKLTELENRSGESLNIQSTDSISVSYTKQGVSYTTSFAVGDLTLKKITDVTDGNLTFASATSAIGTDGAGAAVTTADGKKAISFASGGTGIANMVSGFSISVIDKDGNVKKGANASLDAFSESIHAENTSIDNAMSFQVGTTANQSIKVGMKDMRAEALGLQGADGTNLNISTKDNANVAISVIDNAIAKALDQQTSLGAAMSRLDYTANNLTIASENVTSAESTIRDADMAKEMTEYTKNNVLMQAAQAMLAQANQNSTNVLSLLQ